VTRGAALITGGASGIGAAVARRLAARGVSVVVADRDQVRGPAVAGRIGGRFVAMDVGSPEDNERAVSVAVRKFGRLEVVMLNAGVPGGCGLHDFSPVRYREAMSVDLDGVVYGLHAAASAMRRRNGGAIVVTASLAGLTGSPDLFYATAKHAVVGLVRSAAPLLLPDGIRINALCPGLVDTPLIAPLGKTLRERGALLATADEVAEAFETITESTVTGRAWVVQAGQPARPVAQPEFPLATSQRRRS
jgi:NAD(P)-dependent dehydrogenase (short-subunit alcohol dehydrogenase family)